MVAESILQLTLGKPELIAGHRGACFSSQATREADIMRIMDVGQ
jgi:hypothetical protein